jgi:hypothetical protein
LWLGKIDGVPKPEVVPRPQPSPRRTCHITRQSWALRDFCAIDKQSHSILGFTLLRDTHPRLENIELRRACPYNHEEPGTSSILESSNPRPSYCPIPSFARESRAQTPRRCQDIPGSILLRATTTSTTRHLHILKHPLLGHLRRQNHLPSPRSTSLPSPNYNASKLLSQSPSTTVFSPLRRHPPSRRHSPRTRLSAKQLPKKLKSPRPARANLRAKVSTTESHLRHTQKDPALLTPSPTSWPPQEVRRASSHKYNRHQAHRSTRWEVRCTKSITM